MQRAHPLDVGPARLDVVAELTWDDLDAGRLVVPADLRARLDARRGSSRWVLGVRPTTACGAWKHLARACEDAGVHVCVWTTHALRRLAVDRFARAGVNIKIAAEIMGHNPQVMWSKYQQVSDIDRRRAMATVRLWDLGDDEDNVLRLPAASAGTSGREQVGDVEAPAHRNCAQLDEDEG